MPPELTFIFYRINVLRQIYVGLLVCFLPLTLLASLLLLAVAARALVARAIATAH